MQEKSYRGYTIKIIQDDSPESPREWDNFGTLIGWHRNYRIGDENPFKTPVEAQIHFEQNNSIALPVYLYDHSGCSYSTKPFSCPWDSGHVGYIFVDAEKVRKEFSVKRITKKLREKVCGMLESEVKTYDEWQRGDVYGYQIVSPTGEDLDSCWGFYGSDMKYLEETARDAVDGEILSRIKEKVKKLKVFILNRVPLEKRIYPEAC